MTGTALAPISTDYYTDERRALIKRTIAPGISDDDLELALYDTARRGLDLLAGQVHLVPRTQRTQDERGAWITIKKWTRQVSIDGFRLIAHRTGIFAGCEDTEYGPTQPLSITESAGGQRVSREALVPSWARVTVYRYVAGQRCAWTATARWDEYYPTTGATMWNRMPHVMIGKVAEALALRKAFPAELSGLYEPSEMDQATKTTLNDKYVVAPSPTTEVDAVFQEKRGSVTPRPSLPAPAEPVAVRPAPTREPRKINEGTWPTPATPATASTNRFPMTVEQVQFQNERSGSVAVATMPEPEAVAVPLPHASEDEAAQHLDAIAPARVPPPATSPRLERAKNLFLFAQKHDLTDYLTVMTMAEFVRLPSPKQASLCITMRQNIVTACAERREAILAAGEFPDEPPADDAPWEPWAAHFEYLDELYDKVNDAKEE